MTYVVCTIFILFKTYEAFIVRKGEGLDFFYKLHASLRKFVVSLRYVTCCVLCSGYVQTTDATAIS